MALMAIDPEARNVKAVYILRMGSGLDQFLASELATRGIYTITTDPQKADAIFTETVGESFEKKFDELYPPPEKEKEKPAEPAAGEENAGAPSIASAFTGPTRPASTSWGRGKGTIFLVDRASRTVLWSMARRPKSSSAEATEEQAKKIAGQLQKDLAVK